MISGALLQLLQNFLRAGNMLRGLVGFCSGFGSVGVGMVFVPRYILILYRIARGVSREII